MGGLPLMLLFALFVGSGAVTWFAGVNLTKATDSLDTRWKLGDAIGGLVLLGIAGSLPEIAVVGAAGYYAHIAPAGSADSANHLGIIIGTLIGGLSIQTLLLVLFDFASGRKRPLSYLAGSVMLTLETLFAVVITLIAIAATLVPAKMSFHNVNPLSAGLLIMWVIGLLLINKARGIKRFNLTAEESAPGRKHHQRRKVENHPFYAGKSTLHVVLIFLGASALTLVAGYLLEESGNAIADKLHIGSGIFAATFIALATSIPEISTGLESIIIGDNHLAVSDIMGGNAFMVVLFLLGDLVAKKPVLSCCQRGDNAMFLGIWAVVMMSVYMISFLLRPKKCFFRLGIDSILALLLYAGGVVMLTRL